MGELAELTGVKPGTVRFYARAGLLQPQRDPDNGYRTFAADDVQRLQFIRRAQRVGLTLTDIQRLLADVDAGRTPCTQVLDLVSARLDALDAQIAGLEETRARMRRALEVWGDKAPQRGPDEICPLIERLDVS